MVRLIKGSKQAKAWGAKMRRLRNPKTKSRKTSIKRKSKTKSKKRYTMAKKKRRVSRKTASIWGINTAKALSAGIYGAGRARLSNVIAPYTSKIPAGAAADEVGMVIALQMLKKFAFKKAGVLREAATAGQAIEFARIGELVATGQLGLGGLTPNANSGNLF